MLELSTKTQVVQQRFPDDTNLMIRRFEKGNPIGARSFDRPTRFGYDDYTFFVKPSDGMLHCRQTHRSNPLAYPSFTSIDHPHYINDTFWCDPMNLSQIDMWSDDETKRVYLNLWCTPVVKDVDSSVMFVFDTWRDTVTKIVNKKAQESKTVHIDVTNRVLSTYDGIYNEHINNIDLLDLSMFNRYNIK